MKRWNRSRWWSLLACLLLLAGCTRQTPADQPAAGTEGTSQAADARRPLLGSFTAQDLEGNTVDQSILADHKLTMVNVWATFCTPCLSEMPELGSSSRSTRKRACRSSAS